MASITILGQTIMDLYYQQYKSDEDFFEEEHFQYLVTVAYAKLLQDEYEKSYAKARAEKGRGEAQLNPQWFIPEDHELQASDLGDKEISLKNCPFSFRFDEQSSSIQGVYPLGGKCSELIRTNIESLWALKHVPTTNIVWWYPVGNKIIFKNIHCGLKRVKILYIPSLKDIDDECGVPDSMQGDIMDWVLQRMSVARQGGVIDMTADQNPNKMIETEINTAFRNLKTKP